MKLLLVGGRGGTNVAESLKRGGHQLGLSTEVLDQAQAHIGWTILRRIVWRLNRKPLRLKEFSAMASSKVIEDRAEVLITTGAAPVTARTLRGLRDQGVVCINFSTDDPWNPGFASRWHFAALKQYDVVFTPRRSNLGDFLRLGVRDVRWLPFGYDGELLGDRSDCAVEDASDILFVGGADRDRAEFFDRFCATGLSVTVVGGYWGRYRNVHRRDLGQRSPGEVAALTRASKISIILVRRANRDGHTMRSFEAGAIGGCLLVEDTAEHREIFGADDEAVRYFTSPGEAADIARTLLADEASRTRLATAVRRRITGNRHTYTDRLREMLKSVEDLPARPLEPSDA